MEKEMFFEIHEGAYSEKKVVEIFGTEKQKESYKKHGRLTGSNRKYILNEANNYCELKYLGNYRYSISKIKYKRVPKNKKFTPEKLKRKKQKMISKFYVYKYVYNDEIIYIGKTNNMKRRVYQHSKEEKFKPYLSSEIYYIELSNKAEIKALETLLINEYKPILNVQDKYQSNSGLLVLGDVQWKQFNETNNIKEFTLYDNDYREIISWIINTELSILEKSTIILRCNPYILTGFYYNWLWLIIDETNKEYSLLKDCLEVSDGLYEVILNMKHIKNKKFRYYLTKYINDQTHEVKHNDKNH